MGIGSDPIRTLMERHIGLVEELSLLKATIDRLRKGFFPHILEALKRETLSFLKSMEQHIRCEEEALFPVLKVALSDKSELVISMVGEHANLREEMKRFQTAVTDSEIENPEECKKIINLVDAIIDSLTDLFSKHINKEENQLLRLAREMLPKKELVEIEKRMKDIIEE